MAPAAIERAREAIISRADHTRMSILRLARPFDSRSRHSTLLFEDGLSQFQVSAAAQHFHHAFGLPERALPPAIPAAARREAGGPLPGHAALHYVAAQHPAAAQHPPPCRGLGSKQSLDTRRSSRFSHLARELPAARE